MRRRHRLWFGPTALLLVGWGPWAASGASGASGAAGAAVVATVSSHAPTDVQVVEDHLESHGYEGSDTCLACHDDLEPRFLVGPHSSEAFDQRSALGCESCHGPGAAHVEDPENPSARLDLERWTAQRETEVCATCHEDAQPSFHASPHAVADLSCSSCHSIHNRSGWSAVDESTTEVFQLARVSGSSAQCIQCHTDAAVDFERNERHRLQEGVMDCASCHDPHAPSARVQLGGFKQQACIDCHQDKGGPFVFEHGSVRVEGCSACHEPHGGPNRHQLTFERSAELCYSCHVEVPGFHLGFGSFPQPPRFDLDTNCTNCHSAIHGSNFDPYFLK